MRSAPQVIAHADHPQSGGHPEVGLRLLPFGRGRFFQEGERPAAADEFRRRIDIDRANRRDDEPERESGLVVHGLGPVNHGNHQRDVAVRVPGQGDFPAVVAVRPIAVARAEPLDAAIFAAQHESEGEGHRFAVFRKPALHLSALALHFVRIEPRAGGMMTEVLRAFTPHRHTQDEPVDLN